MKKFDIDNDPDIKAAQARLKAATESANSRFPIVKNEFPESSEWLHGGWMYVVYFAIGGAIGVVLGGCLMIKWLSSVLH